MKERDTLDRLIEMLCAERGEEAPVLPDERKADFFRALCNVRPPLPVSEEFLRLQDEYLSACVEERGVVDVDTLDYRGGIALWRGDITRLNADAVVNACNSALLGCFSPLHGCIDNIIHSRAGVQLRLECNDIMHGGEEPNGRVRVTGAYNLPCKHVFHTVGPVVRGKVSARDEKDLASCYVSCMDEAARMGLNTIAFCCISTGVFGYPKAEACRVAVRTVRERIAALGAAAPKVIFDVFTEEDEDVYQRELEK